MTDDKLAKGLLSSNIDSKYLEMYEVFKNGKVDNDEQTQQTIKDLEDNGCRVRIIKPN